MELIAFVSRRLGTGEFGLWVRQTSGNTGYSPELEEICHLDLEDRRSGPERDGGGKGRSTEE